MWHYLIDRLSRCFGLKIVDLDFISFDILREEALISCRVGAKKSAAVALHASSRAFVSIPGAQRLQTSE
jgi:hypothetical protein